MGTSIDPSWYRYWFWQGLLICLLPFASPFVLKLPYFQCIFMPRTFTRHHVGILGICFIQCSTLLAGFVYNHLHTCTWTSTQGSDGTVCLKDHLSLKISNHLGVFLVDGGKTDILTSNTISKICSRASILFYSIYKGGKSTPDNCPPSKLQRQRYATYWFLLSHHSGKFIVIPQTHSTTTT